MHFILVALGGGTGALIRWGLGGLLNPIFPTMPLGTLVVNLSGGYIIGIMMGLIHAFPSIPESVRLAIITGFLGGLTTFSTFSAETTHLILEKNYLYTFIILIANVGGAILLTLLGIYSVKLLFLGRGV